MKNNNFYRKEFLKIIVKSNLIIKLTLVWKQFVIKPNKVIFLIKMIPKSIK